MMKGVTVMVNGREYPCRQTMGAALRYKRATGTDVSKLQADDLEGLCTYLWCCVGSACKADDIEFGLSLEDFADNLEMAEVSKWAQTLGKVPENEKEEKKRVSL